VWAGLKTPGVVLPDISNEHFGVVKLFSPSSTYLALNEISPPSPVTTPFNFDEKLPNCEEPEVTSTIPSALISSFTLFELSTEKMFAV